MHKLGWVFEGLDEDLSPKKLMQYGESLDA